MLISVESPSLTTPITSNLTGILSWLKYDQIRKLKISICLEI